MSTTNDEVGTSAVLPKSLSASSLWSRAGIGLLMLTLGTFGAVWLFDASIKANASSQVASKSITQATAKAATPALPAQ